MGAFSGRRCARRDRWPESLILSLSLFSDKDEEIRRTAIEILNNTKSKAAVDHLIKATDDSDWWVRERGVDALAKIGDSKALPKIESMLGANAKTDTVVIRALGKLGNHTHIQKIVPMLKRPEREIQIEAIKAMTVLTNDSQAESVRKILNTIKQSDDATIINIADKAIRDLDDRYSETMVEQNIKAEKISENTRTLLVDNEDLEKLLEEAKEQSAVAQADDDGAAIPASDQAAPAPMAPAVLDISTLNPGDVIRRALQIHRENR